MNESRITFDVAYIGNYTKDTIHSPAGVSHVDGGGAHYAAFAGARLGFRVAVVTRLSREDRRVVDRLENAGVAVFARYTSASTCVLLEYPTSDVDVRNMYITSLAGEITVAEIEAVSAKAAVLGTSVRGEVGLEAIQRLRARGLMLAADMQGFVRVLQGDQVVHEPWPEQQAVLACLDVVKVDAVEARFLTGEVEPRAACRILADMGPGEIMLTHRQGLVVYDHGAYHEAEFHPARMNGRSGRGDTCLGSYMAMRRTRTPAQATLWAAAVTSLKMETLGPFDRPMCEVEDLLRREYSGEPASSDTPTD